MLRIAPNHLFSSLLVLVAGCGGAERQGDDVDLTASALCVQNPAPILLELRYDASTHTLLWTVDANGSPTAAAGLAPPSGAPFRVALTGAITDPESGAWMLVYGANKCSTPDQRATVVVTRPEVCGDGEVTGTEVCDSGGVADDLCRSDCRLTTDQQQLVTDTGAPYVYAVGSSSEQYLAQVVTPVVTGLLTEVDLALVGCAEGIFSIAVHDVENGIPTWSVRATSTFTTEAVQSLPRDAQGFLHFTLSSGVPIAAGVPYALVIFSTGSCGIDPGPVADPYAGGDSYYGNTPDPFILNGQFDGRYDLAFRTIVSSL